MVISSQKKTGTTKQHKITRKGVSLHSSLIFVPVYQCTSAHPAPPAYQTFTFPALSHALARRRKPLHPLALGARPARFGKNEGSRPERSRRFSGWSRPVTCLLSVGLSKICPEYIHSHDRYNCILAVKRVLPLHAIADDPRQPDIYRNEFHVPSKVP